MSRAERIFKGVVATAVGLLGLLAGREHKDLQAQRAKLKADLAIDANDILSGRRVEDPERERRANEMINGYGLKNYDPEPSGVVQNPRDVALQQDRPLRDGRI